MIYRTFQNEQLSLLGMGCMRLPLIEGTHDVDEAQTEEMIRYALSYGVNYFDTAWPYHGGVSETVVGRILNQFPRESWKLASKYPGHQIMAEYNAAELFEEQLRKCGVEYFDYYLLHNVCELSLPVYSNPQWGIIDYFIEQRRLGRICHLGFSSHAGVDCLRTFLDERGEDMEFCQIQLNYLDWTLQDAKTKYELLTERGIPVWVMEPVRGGKLASLPDAFMQTLSALRPQATPAEWALRWLQQLPNVHMVLSGASSLQQMQENVATFETEKPLNQAENAALLDVAEQLKSLVPCTGCRYCVDGCPMGLDIPALLGLYNEARYAYAVNIGTRIDAMGDGKRPQDCIDCGQCTQICPQKIDVPEALAKFSELISHYPTWAELCKEREEAAKKLKK